MSTFTIRKATLLDLPSITNVTAAGLPDDPVGDYLAPNGLRKQYPQDYYFFWHQTFKEWLYKPNTTLLVAIEENHNPKPNQAKETVVAYAVWERNTPNPGLLQSFLSYVNRDKWDILGHILTTLESRFINAQFNRRDSSPKRVEAFFSAAGKIRGKYWSPTGTYPHNYKLNLLCTHPDFRRRGAGSVLTQWGITQAKREGFAVGVGASPMGFPMYSGLGFKLLETWKFQIEGEEEFYEGRIMVLDDHVK